MSLLSNGDLERSDNSMSGITTSGINGPVGSGYNGNNTSDNNNITNGSNSMYNSSNNISNNNSNNDLKSSINFNEKSMVSLPCGSQMFMISNPRNMRYYMLVVGILFFFGCHNYMQELIMRQPGFTFGVMLGYLEVLGTTICSYLERVYHRAHYNTETVRRVPLRQYLVLSLFLLISSCTSNLALNWINYPTKVVFRSSKLVPTMIIAVFLNNKKVHNFEFIFGTGISIGMICFAIADFQVYPEYNIIGIILVCISVLADAVLPNYQERLFDYGASRLEVTFFTNINCLIAMTVFFLLSGDIQSMVALASTDRHLTWLLLIYTFLAYISITFHMALVKEYGGIATVLVGNTRKAITIVLSFIFFPKPVSIYYLLGGVLVFGCLMGNAFMKEKIGGASGKKNGEIVIM